MNPQYTWSEILGGLVGATLAAIAFVLTIAWAIPACRTVVPVVQVQTTYQCTVTDSDHDGNVTLDCRSDGHKTNVPVKAPGDDSAVIRPPDKTSGRFWIPDWRLN